MAPTPLRLAAIVGSTREGRFGTTVARWFVGQVESRDDFELDLIDLADLNLPANLTSTTDPVVDGYLERLTCADGFVLITPEYNHGYPASLKQAIDLGDVQWRAKPVAFVSYGGMAGGLRAVEQLRQVFPELHAMTIRDCVSFHNPWTMFDEDGRSHRDVGADVAAKVMLDQLAWWAGTLRDARAANPYGG